LIKCQKDLTCQITQLFYKIDVFSIIVYIVTGITILNHRCRVSGLRL